MESIPCRAVIEERNRLAREIHDTLVQEFAGILLHLEAVNGLGLRVNAPNSWLAQESSPNLVGRRAQDATRKLGLCPKSYRVAPCENIPRPVLFPMLLTYTSAGVVLVIKDDRRAFAMRQPGAGAQGFGLPAMCGRASRLGGRMDINSGQGTGTEIRMSVPLSGKHF